MSHSVLISDLHLCVTRPAINQIFFDFLKGTAAKAEALYILGDLFEYWAGDDDDDSFNASVITALADCDRSGAKIYLLHGNRDFLIGKQFSAASGATLLSDPTPLNLYGVPTLLMHGDTLCIDDVEYQKFRAYSRNPDTQQSFLARPLATRKQEIVQLRAHSEASKQTKNQEIMDVATVAVEAVLRKYNYPRLIHGHTHRPAHHIHIVDGHRCERWVLADWYHHGSYLHCDSGGCRPVGLS